MKKLLIFVLVLGMASMALAVPVFQVDPCDAKDFYMPSDMITIQLVDTDVLTFSVDAIVDNAGGTAAEPQTFNAGLGFTIPGALNVGGHLVEYVQASITTVPSVPVNGVLYTFEYHVPNVPASTWIVISSFADGDLYWDPYFTYKTQPDYEGSVGEVAIHVIPEPATIALLGLGGLLLRRRK